MLPPIKTDDCVYTAFYCEENVYKLCEQLETLSCELYAVFVSNQHKQVTPLLLLMSHDAQGATLRVDLLHRYPFGTRRLEAPLPVWPFGTITCLLSKDCRTAARLFGT